MEQALTSDVIRAQREIAEGDIARGEQLIRAARQRLADCDAADRMLAMLGGAQADSGTTVNARALAIPPVMYGGGFGFRMDNPFKPNTNKAFIWEALWDVGLWSDAVEIQARASDMKGEPIPMSSVSPSLSEMKDEYLERRGMKIALKARLNENGEAEASPDAGGAPTPSIYTQGQLAAFE